MLPHWCIMVAFVKTPVVLDGPLEVQPSNLPPFYIIFFCIFDIKKNLPTRRSHSLGSRRRCSWAKVPRSEGSDLLLSLVRLLLMGRHPVGKLFIRHWDQFAVYGDVFKGSVQHLTGGFIEQNSSCSDVSKWKSSSATYPD